MFVSFAGSLVYAREVYFSRSEIKQKSTQVKSTQKLVVSTASVSDSAQRMAASDEEGKAE